MTITISKTIRATPEVLVENGRIHTGFFTAPFRRVNLLDADIMGGRLARPMRWLRLKEWVGFGLNHPRLFGGVLIQNAKYAGSGTVYLFDKASGRLYDWLVVDPRARLPEHLWGGTSRCHQGKRWMRFEHDLPAKRHHALAESPASRDLPALSLDLVLHQDWENVDPLVVSLPIGAEHHTYTHKSPLRLAGTIKIGDEVFTFDPARDLGNLDEQKTFYPYRSKWFWGTCVTTTDEGKEVLVNFVDQMTPPDEQGEDAMWIDGRLTLLPRPKIIPEADDVYRIEDDEGRLKLRFTPKGAKREKRNFGFAAMDYVQFCGDYEGTVVDDQGYTHTLRNAFGAFERMRARF